MNMVILWAFWIGVPIISAIISIAVYMGLKWITERRNMWFGWADDYVVPFAGFSTFMYCLLLGYKSSVNSVGEPIAIISPTGQVVATLGQNRELIWAWDDRLVGNRVIDISEVKLRSITMKLQPITSNPKVRQLTYWVDVIAVGTPEARLKYLRNFKTFAAFGSSDRAYQPDATRFVQYQLYEFEERHSKELSTLYNPLDERQQAKLLELLQANLGSALNEVGLRIDTAGFILRDEK